MSAPARSPIQPSTRMPLSRTENSVLRDLLDHRSGNTALRSHAQTAIDTAMKHKSISQSAVRTLEQKGYLWRLNKDRDVLYCEFPPDVIEAFAPKPLDRDYYKTLCLYILFLGKKLSQPENSVARVIAESVSGPRHLGVV